MGRDWRDRVRLWVIVGVIVAIPLSICVYFWFVVRGSPIGSRSGVFGGRGLDPAEGLVAFTATGEGSRSLQVIGVDGDDPVVIDEGLSHQSSPSWSPDGSQVVYAVDSGTDQVLWVAPAGGGGAPVQLTSREGESFSQDQRPVWSPDRRHVAFVDNRSEDDVLYVMNADGTGQTDVVDGEGDIEDLHWLSPPG